MRAQVGAERVSPMELRERTARRRREATERVLALLPPEKHDEFRSIVKDLEGYVSIREGRAYWQLVISGDMRGFLLRIGEDLLRNGRIDRADDIFFVSRTTTWWMPRPTCAPWLLPAGASGNAGVGVDPPLVIGTPGEVLAEAETKRAAFRGSPASRGQVTGPVRILKNPEEGSRLQRGDILVCVMTTPAWTPLFAIAGGIVTETGGALSHPAITAREYGIPAVVALADATNEVQGRRHRHHRRHSRYCFDGDGSARVGQSVVSARISMAHRNARPLGARLMWVRPPPATRHLRSPRRGLRRARRAA